MKPRFMSISGINLGLAARGMPGIADRPLKRLRCFQSLFSIPPGLRQEKPVRFGPYCRVF
jgi:hypothetical protein